MVTGIPPEVLAVCRGFTDIPYAESVAVGVDAMAVLQGLFRSSQKAREFVHTMTPFFELRFKSVTALALARGTKQILEIAAGLSTRGLAMTDADPALHYVETDLPAEIESKRRLLDRLLPPGTFPRDRLRLVSADALEFSQLAEAAGSLRGPLTVVSEGLLLWSDVTFQRKAAKNIHRLLDSYGGVWITPDFTAGELEIRRFLNNLGFGRVDTFVRRALIGRLSSIEKLGLQEQEVMMKLSNRRVHCITR